MGEIALLAVIAILFAAIVPGLWADLRAAWRTCRAGATPERRRHGMAAWHDVPKGAPVVCGPRGGYAAIRPSPGHRNFGVPRRSVALTDVLSGQHPGLSRVADHVLGDH